MDASLHHETAVALAVEKARGTKRLTGLIGAPSPGPGEALLIERCRSVHGCFMRNEIDVVFVDEQWRVLRVASLRPWRARHCRRARHTLELGPGEARRRGIVPGTQIENIFEKGG